VFPHALNGVRHTGVPNLRADARFRFAETVTNRSVSGRFFLPHRNAKIIFSEHIPGIVEIDNGALGIGTETIRSGLETSKRGLSQQCLHG
jgi:hypothetical protein